MCKENLLNFIIWCVLDCFGGAESCNLPTWSEFLTLQDCFRLRASHLDELSDLTRNFRKIRCREGHLSGFGLNGVEELWTSQSFDGTEKGNEAFDPERMVPKSTRSANSRRLKENDTYVVCVRKHEARAPNRLSEAPTITSSFETKNHSAMDSMWWAPGSPIHEWTRL